MRGTWVFVAAFLMLAGVCCAPTSPPLTSQQPATVSTQSVTPLKLDFGSVSPGCSNSLSLRVNNLTANPIESSVKSSNKHFSVNPSVITLQPFESRLLTVTYSPLKHGRHKCTISFGARNLKTVKCQGRGGENKPTRDKYYWPFSISSIWNTPIGSEAHYVSAGLRPSLWIAPDKEYLYFEGRERLLYGNGKWPGECSGSNELAKIIVPDGALIPANDGNTTSAFVLADGNTVYQANPTARCDPTGPAYAGWKAPTVNLYGDGIGGGHGGSSLATLGGSIRLGELFSLAPIRHALKIDIWMARHGSKTQSGFRWPAARADHYYLREYDKEGVAKPAVRMGCLLAIPSNMNLDSLGLKTDPAMKIAQALRDYGAYVVDDSYWDAVNLCVESGVPAEFATRCGYDFSQQSGDWYDDMMKLFQLLCVVDNNTPTTVGGGGLPLVPPAPPIGN